jgi:ribosomal protein S18 acetylase RimI-like enzyme
MTVPSIDSIRSEIGARAARHLELAFARFLSSGPATHDERFLRLASGAPHPLGNFAVVRASDDVAATVEAAEPLAESGLPACVILPRGADAAVEAALAELGFGVEDRLPAMAVDIDALAPTALPDGYAWTRVTEGADGRDWAEALAVGYELPRTVADLFAPAAVGAAPAADADVQFFAVVRDGRQVATSTLCLADGLAGIYCVSTLPDERGRGLGAHATAEPLRIARELGYRVGVLQSSHAGHSVYRGLGFDDHAEVKMRVRIPG